MSGGVLQLPVQSSDTPDVVDKAGWWLVPGTPQQVLAWEAKYLPHQFETAGIGSSGAPGPEAELFETFSLPVVYGVLDLRGLQVQTVADGQQTAIRVDAQVSWTPTRPVSDKIPLAARAVTVSEDLGGNQGSAKSPQPVTVTDPAKVRELAAATAELSGCPVVRFSIGGRPQPALASVSGPQILAITGLPWKTPAA